MANEKRLIDANALAKEIDFEYDLNYGEILTDPRRFAEMVEDASTVDAVEVVRCKDCRWARTKDHREPIDTPGELICQCFMHHHIPAPWGARLAVKEDDFCSYGERKDNGKKENDIG